MKQNNFPILVLAITAISAIATGRMLSPVYAEEASTKKEANVSPSVERLSNISQNCGSIRNSLKLLQRSDSRARTYFGSIYETVSSKYLIPLNLRLVKNNISDISLIDLQSSIATDRSAFSTDFIAYSKSLEELIDLDCRLNPEDFYEKLVETRELRKTVASDMDKINESLVKSVKSVKKLEDSLDDKTEEE